MIIGGAAMWLAGGSIGQAVVKAGMYIAIAGAVILLLTGGRNNKGIGKVTGGLSSLYNITSYISDILSYVKTAGPGSGYRRNRYRGQYDGLSGRRRRIRHYCASGGFVVGHTFNLAINALGAFVHSSRLQYIEFFGKFYEDGGDEFDPLRKKTKYIRIISDTDGGKKWK